MSEEAQTLLIIRGAIASLPESELQDVKAAALELRSLLQRHGDCGWTALALVAAEKAAETE